MARFLAFLSLLLLGLLPTCQPFLIVPASSTPRGPTPLHSTNDPELLPDLTHDDISRYSRHLVLGELGMVGQRRLKGSSVLCVGSGGLGSPALLYLAAAGVGRIGVIDNDVVDISNLQRQVIHGLATVGKPKVESAKARIHDMNPTITVDTYQERLSPENALDVLRKYDVIVDGSDNFPTRYLVNDASVMLGLPLVYGAILRFQGQASLFNYQGGPNYRDLLPQAPPAGAVPSCAEGGVLGVLPGLIGCIQATEAIKVMTGIGETLSGRVLIYDALKMSFREVQLERNPDAAPITALQDSTYTCPDAPKAAEAKVEYQRITVEDALEKLGQGWTPYVLDVRLPQEADIVKLPFVNRLCPHREVASIVDDLPRDQDILVYCKSGGRSGQACTTLAKKGFTNVINLEGGITAWAKRIDTRLPVY